MICKKCNQSIPDDSDFCQFCGEKIEHTVYNSVTQTNNENIGIDSSHIHNEEKPISNIVRATNKKPKTPQQRYCKICGNLIDNETKKCTSCGKQYFKFNKNIAVGVVGLLVIIALIVTNVIQFFYTMDLEEDIKQKDRVISQNKSRISSLENSISTIQSGSNMDFFALSFYNENAAIVPDNGSNLYHKYGCSDLDTTQSFWIYNTVAAENKGYSPCPKCYK